MTLRLENSKFEFRNSDSYNVVPSFQKGMLERLGQCRQTGAIASFQHGMLESRLTWMSPTISCGPWIPAVHAGMSEENP
jgi:hypothetical protein